MPLWSLRKQVFTLDTLQVPSVVIQGVSQQRPDIFISATTADLGRARQAVKEALLTLGVHPIEQTNFPPDYRTIKEMLRKKIAECDAVIEVVAGPDKGRRGWTLANRVKQIQ